MRHLLCSFVLLTSLGGHVVVNACEPPQPSSAPRNAPEQEAQRKTWPVLTNSIGMKFVLLPAGEFQMGSPVSDRAATDAEKPRHRVTLENPFQLGMYEVTQAQYEKVMGENPSRFKGPRNPVENVSWQNAIKFCEKLSSLPSEQSTGSAYHLPTEAEWEYACRAGTTTIHSFDDSLTDDYAWHIGNSDDRTHPVGEKKPNAWGLFDMHGNVNEWSRERVHRFKKYEDGRTVQSGVIPVYVYEPGNRVVYRSGDWASKTTRCRSAFRMMSSTFKRGFSDHYQGRMGFRVLRHSANQPDVESR